MAPRSMRADAVEPAVRLVDADELTHSVDVPGADAPVKKIDGATMRLLGQNLRRTFEQYRSDRRIQELRWVRNQRQYLGFYDPEIESSLGKDRSRAYPKITRVKVITMLAHIMNLMFPSDDRNWTVTARPSHDMDINDVKKAITTAQAKDAAENGGQPPSLTKDYVMNVVQTLATQRAADATVEIDDQLQELGGDQSYDYIQLNNETVLSGILNGIGLLVGPFARELKTSTWTWDETKAQPSVKTTKKYMPQFNFLPVWDFYPDMSAKKLQDMEGWFSREIISKHQLVKYSKQSDFFGDTIRSYLSMHQTGNYKPLEFETDLRSMGVKVNVSDTKPDSTKYEVIVWHGPIDGRKLKAAGVDVAEDKLDDMIMSEVWMVEEFIIKAIMNPWAELEEDVQTLHWFLFDKDDTSPIGFGLPNIMRDTQMSISATTRMMLDNASVVCGPIVEMNTNLLTGSQDLSSISAYQVFYRNDDAPTAQFPAIRAITIDSHLNDLEKLIELFMKFADLETFVGPMTGGDMSKMPGEPMRNLAGASMLMGAASLPFKQIIRNFDNLTRTVIQSIIQFNRVFNPDIVKVSNYDVIARGATSLIAKEVRGIQIDALAASLKPQEEPYVDWAKMAKGRFAVRDAEDMLLSKEDAAKAIATQAQAAALDKQLQQAGIEANTRYLLAQAFKNIAQGQKNQAGADAEAVDTALDVMERGAVQHGIAQLVQGAPGGAAAPAPGPAAGPVVPDAAGAGGSVAGPGPAPIGGMLPGPVPG